MSKEVEITGRWTSANEQQAEGRFQRLPKERYVIRENTPGSWMVWDTMLPDTPKMALVMFVREHAAEKICDILNDEWRAFLRNPD